LTWPPSASPHPASGSARREIVRWKGRNAKVSCNLPYVSSETHVVSKPVTLMRK